MKYKVFVDGQEGTTGLEIRQRLAGRSELEILSIDPEKRKDPEARSELINSADVVFLCLPDTAARESASLVCNDRTCVLDASTAHRTHPEWTYGIPELKKGQRDKIRGSRRISVPGCHATGFVVLMAPLVAEGRVPSDYPASFLSLTGYSGGGKKLISYYEEELVARNTLNAQRMYAMTLQHKHLPEVTFHSGLRYSPVFTPVLANIYKGMVVSVPLQTHLLPGRPDAQELHRFFSDYYKGESFIKVMPFGGDAGLDDGYLHPMGCNDTNRLEIFVFGHKDQILLSSRLDNLGKGASGAAVQCMNIHLGLDETTGLQL